jgi:hypothetical protein
MEKEKRFCRVDREGGVRLLFIHADVATVYLV